MDDQTDSHLDQYWTALQQNRQREAAELRNQIAGSNDSERKALRLLEDLNDARLLLRNGRSDLALETANNHFDQTSPEAAEAAQIIERTHLGDYELKEKIAEGGMGIVFAATQISMNRQVAIKFIKSGRLSNIEDLRRFNSESMIGGRLTHPGVVQVYENGVADGIPFFSMELIEGKNLSQLLNDGPLDSRRSAAYVKAICEAVENAHSHGILHRDLKPSNILIDSHDSPRITDFGLAKWLECDPRPGSTPSSLTMTGTTIGTPSYMSPEQALGQNNLVTVASDIYSMGAILYECLTGRPPFRADSPVETLRQVVDADPALPRVLNRNIPRDLETICLKALQKNPASRYESAAAFAKDLERFINGRPIEARPVSTLRRLHLWCGRNRALAATLSLLFFSLVGGTIVSTAMWLKSEKNFDKQKKTAADLMASRLRLRDSVSQFQSKVFSTESLHWQMSSQFRAEMFRDVIDYLDEFAAFDDEFSKDNDDIDDISQEYLKIAETALAVGSFDEAELASKKAYERIQGIIGRRASDLANDWLLKSISERMLFLSRESRLAHDTDSPKSLDLLHASLKSALHARRLASNEAAYIVNQLNAEFQLATRDDSKNKHARLQRIADDLIRYDDLYNSGNDATKVKN